MYTHLIPILMLLLACSSRHGDGGSTGQAGSPPSAKVKAPAPAIVGTWRLIDEQAIDGKALTLKQQVREYHFAADGSYSVRSYHETWADEWRLDGDELTLHHRVDPVPMPGSFDAGGQVPARTDRGVEVEIESLTSDRLVLVEVLPAILQRDAGPPRRVRNTYRRVSEADLGPLLGENITTATPTAGKYAATYAYRSSKYPTMEIHISKSIDGHAVLELAADGTANACLAVRTHRHFSRSKYASRDGKHHSEKEERRQLLSARGKWLTGAGKATVVLDEKWAGNCQYAGETMTHASIRLTCVGLEPNQRLPVAVLACELGQPALGLEKIAINPADSPRAGPFTLQLEPTAHFTYDQGKPWLLMGAPPGLLIESEEDKNHSTPQVELSAKSVDIVEGNFVDRADKR